MQNLTPCPSVPWSVPVPGGPWAPRKVLCTPRAPHILPSPTIHILPPCQCLWLTHVPSSSEPEALPHLRAVLEAVSSPCSLCPATCVSVTESEEGGKGP